MQNVTALGRIREDWQKEHVKACEVRARKHQSIFVGFLVEYCITFTLFVIFVLCRTRSKPLRDFAMRPMATVTEFIDCNRKKTEDGSTTL